MTTQRARQLTLLACILGSGIVFLDGSAINVALPAIERDLQAGLAAQQWIVEAYLVTLSALLLVGGAVGDRVGRKRVFLIGVAGFGVTSLMCALAPDAPTLVGSRALQGIAGALLTPSSLAIITATFPPDERAGAIGAWTSGSAITTVLGPVIGGVLVDTLSWRWVFVIKAPLVLIALAVAARAMAESRDPDATGPIDWWGAGLISAGLGLIVVGLIEQPLRGWSDPLVLGSLVAGLLACAAFVVVEARSRQPMVPLGMFARRDFAVGNVA
ncbi:MAG: MFS transporter, partial [Dehalococcoidia bacterium]|nr:MFS transporter [Dehalococcoidia bacterium]